MSKSLTLRLDRFGRDALDDYVRNSSGSRPLAMRTALRYYLTDSDSRRASWPVPALARGGPTGEALEIELDEELHTRLDAESRRQEVAPDVLAVHALLYFLGDLASGRAAARLGDAIARDAEAS